MERWVPSRMLARENLVRAGMASGLWALEMDSASLGLENLLMCLIPDEVHFLKLHSDRTVRMTQRRILKEIKL